MYAHGYSSAGDVFVAVQYRGLAVALFIVGVYIKKIHS
jgi:hypothetical protein